MFRVAFVYPGYENLGIEYLSATLKKRGIQTKLFFDPVLFSESGFLSNRFLGKLFSFQKYLLREIINYKPDLVCFSVVTDNYPWAIRWAREIKYSLGTLIIFGGIHPTALPERVLNEPFVDYVCIGEGDIALAELAAAMKEKMPVTRIKNIWTKNDSLIIKNEVRPLIPNLDDLPFPDKDLYYLSASIFREGYLITTSRGCPHSCTYCANNLLRNIYQGRGDYLRRRSVSNVIAEMEKAKVEYKPRFIHFSDEVFSYDTEWLESFIPIYRKNIGLPFACYVSPPFVNKKVVGLLKEGGCYKVQMGVQTLNEDSRIKLLKRVYTNEQIIEAIKLFRKHKIYLTCDNIFGLPGQDEDELIEMSEFYNKNRPDHIEVFWLKYYPAAPILSIARNMGWVDDNNIKAMESSAIGIVKGGDTYNREFGRFQLLLNLLYFMPTKLVSFILRKGIYRLFPLLSPICITILFRLFNRARFDLYAAMTVRRYIHMIKRKALFIFRA
ncbi:MAG: radical SAM protein [Candidatus Omnitrophota bacterium]